MMTRQRARSRQPRRSRSFPWQTVMELNEAQRACPPPMAQEYPSALLTSLNRSSPPPKSRSRHWAATPKLRLFRRPSGSSRLLLPTPAPQKSAPHL